MTFHSVLQMLFDAYWKGCPEVNIDTAKQSFVNLVACIVNDLYEK